MPSTLYRLIQTLRGPPHAPMGQPISEMIGGTPTMFGMDVLA